MMTRLGIRLLALALVLGPCSRAPAEDASSLPASTVEPSPTPELEASSEPEVTVEPRPEPEAAPGPTFTVIARLVDTGDHGRQGLPVSHCGMIHYKPVMKFEVLRVVDGRFEPTTLYAGVSCPEMPPTRARKFRWTEGATYELTLHTAGLRRAGTVFDSFEGEPGKRFELLHIEPVVIRTGARPGKRVPVGVAAVAVRARAVDALRRGGTSSSRGVVAQPRSPSIQAWSERDSVRTCPPRQRSTSARRSVQARMRSADQLCR